MLIAMQARGRLATRCRRGLATAAAMRRARPQHLMLARRAVAGSPEAGKAGVSIRQRPAESGGAYAVLREAPAKSAAASKAFAEASIEELLAKAHDASAVVWQRHNDARGLCCQAPKAEGRESWRG